ncbi:hypothetical protein [Kocuria flava]|uniref:hypothetical protein n=1 Tax=Kocuria flava TaxID=446860 RepID=UPI0027E3306D|nr:hypothetical protein [Kocuria flava]
MRRDAAAALAATGAAVAAVAVTTGLGPAGTVLSALAALAVTGAVVRSTTRRSAEPYGPADRVTVARSVLVSAVAALLPAGLAPVLAGAPRPRSRGAGRWWPWPCPRGCSTGSTAGWPAARARRRRPGHGSTRRSTPP